MLFIDGGISMSYLQYLDKMGEYAFEDHFFYDPVAHKSENLDATKIHEGIHYYLTQNSTCGLVTSVLLQLARECGNKKVHFSKIAQVLINHSRKTQEACATFTECIFIRESYGVSACKKKVEKLNREYYKYIQDLIPLLDCNNTNILKLVLDAGLIALDINFLVLPKGFIRVSNKLERFIQQNTIIFNSDKRFKLIIEQIINKLNAGEDISSISLQDICSFLSIKNNEDDDIQRMILEWIKLELSPEILPEFIETFVYEREKDDQMTNSYFDSGLPLPMNKRFIKKSGMPDWNTPGVLVLFYFKPDFFIGWLDYIEGVSYNFKADVDNTICLFQRLSNKPFIITREDYLEIYDLLKENFDTSRLFVYNNQLYQKAQIFIETHISEGREIFMMEYNKKAYFLFVKLRDNYVLIQPVEHQDVPKILRSYNYINSDSDENAIFYNNKTSWIMYEDIIYALLQMKMYDKFDEVRPNSIIFR